MPTPTRRRDPYIRQKFTKEQSFARQHAKEYFEKYPKDRFQTEIESWRELQSRNIEYTMKRLREPLNSEDSPWPPPRRRDNWPNDLQPRMLCTAHRNCRQWC
jgi:hypothetical protein